MSQHASPRGTFLEIADRVRAQIERDPEMIELPPAADLMKTYRVSRGTVLRAFEVLRKDGVAEPVRGRPWRVVRVGQHVDRRPLSERIAELVVTEQLAVGAPFPSASELASRFGVSRPTVTKALDKLEVAGVLASKGQGRVRTVLAVPSVEEEKT